MKREIILASMAFLIGLAIYYMNPAVFSLEWFIGLAASAGIAAVLHRLNRLEKTDILLAALVFFIASFSYTFYFGPAVSIEKGSGPILNDNWFNALTWIRENTDECATIATYWDPGHFIRAIAKRTVIFDGGSQNALLVVPANVTESRLDIIPYESGIHRIIKYENGERITARIQDAAISMLTPDESLALDILEYYKKPGCNEMYFLATSDLIGKSAWWTYFSTWSPEKEGDKGSRYLYSMIGLTQARPMPAQNSIAYVYAFGQSQAIVIYDTNGTMVPYLQQGNQFVKISKIFYFTNNGAVMRQTPEAEVNSLIWMDPSKQLIVMIQPELENAIFTKMFFFNGAGLERFELVNSWGGEVKLFKIKFDEEAGVAGEN